MIVMFFATSVWTDSLKRKGSLGIAFKEINLKIQKEKKLSVSSGILILDIAKGASADKAGLKKNDVITEINGIAIKKRNEFLTCYRINETIKQVKPFMKAVKHFLHL